MRCQRLIAAACALRGEALAGPEDLWPIVYAIRSADEQQLAQEALRELLASAKNETLVYSSEAAAAGPAARAQRLLREAQDLTEQTESSEDHRLRLEAWLRELDASLDAGELPQRLSELKERFTRELQR